MEYTARIVRRTGWSWEYVWKTCDVVRAEALEKQWGDEPLTHRLLAAFMGVKKKKRGSLADLVAQFPTGKIE